mmetsp:Transcript_8565/g.21055  ORF Transcript_8565/g.21055 Transcript_8565/m.21055 type:complete len:295 (-) Transcript_8565:817-1701(-)
MLFMDGDRVHNQQPQVSVLAATHRPGDADLFDFIHGVVSNPRRVRDGHRIPPDVETHLDEVSCRARYIRHDRLFAVRKRVEEAGLARVWDPDDGHTEPVTNYLPAFRVAEHVLHLPMDAREQRHHLREDGGLDNVRLVLRKVDDGLHMRQHSDQALSPGIVPRREVAPHLLQGLGPLGLGLARQKVPEGLDLHEVHLPILVRPSRELAPLGGAEAVDVAKGLEDPVDHDAAPMDVQLHDVVAGEAPRGGEVQRQRPMLQALALLIVERALRRPPRLWRRLPPREGEERGHGETA